MRTGKQVISGKPGGRTRQRGRSVFERSSPRSSSVSSHPHSWDYCYSEVWEDGTRRTENGAGGAGVMPEHGRGGLLGSRAGRARGRAQRGRRSCCDAGAAGRSRCPPRCRPRRLGPRAWTLPAGSRRAARCAGSSTQWKAAREGGPAWPLLSGALFHPYELSHLLLGVNPSPTAAGSPASACIPSRTRLQWRC